MVQENLRSFAKGFLLAWSHVNVRLSRHGCFDMAPETIKSILKVLLTSFTLEEKNNITKIWDNQNDFLICMGYEIGFKILENKEIKKYKTQVKLNKASSLMTILYTPVSVAIVVLSSLIPYLMAFTAFTMLACQALLYGIDKEFIQGIIKNIFPKIFVKLYKEELDEIKLSDSLIKYLIENTIANRILKCKNINGQKPDLESLSNLKKDHLEFHKSLERIQKKFYNNKSEEYIVVSNFFNSIKQKYHSTLKEEFFKLKLPKRSFNATKGLLEEINKNFPEEIIEQISSYFNESNIVKLEKVASCTNKKIQKSRSSNFIKKILEESKAGQYSFREKELPFRAASKIVSYLDVESVRQIKIACKNMR